MEIHFLFCMNADFSPSRVCSFLSSFLFSSLLPVTKEERLDTSVSRGEPGRGGSMGINVFIVVSEKVSGYVKSFETFETLRE